MTAKWNNLKKIFPSSGRTDVPGTVNIFYGGLPHILAEPDSEAKENYLERLNIEIYIKDIVDRYEIRESAGMEMLMRVIASAVGSLTNAQKISDTFKSNGDKTISMPTI